MQIASPMVAMIFRGLLGVVIGLLYGAVIGTLTFVWWRLTHDPAHPGPMIPDENGWGRLVTFFATVFASFFGALVGVIVGLTRVNQTRGLLIGGAFGLIIFVFLVIDQSRGIPTSQRYWTELLTALVVYFVMVPIGLGLTGLATSAIARKLST
jgi:predicted branched-subunit amino acid permease